MFTAARLQVPHRTVGAREEIRLRTAARPTSACGMCGSKYPAEKVKIEVDQQEPVGCAPTATAAASALRRRFNLPRCARCGSRLTVHGFRAHC